MEDLGFTAPVLTGHLVAARVAVDAAAVVPMQAVGEFEISEGIANLHALEAQAHALKLALLAEAERRDLASRRAAASTGAWAARLTGSTAAVMAGGLRLARLLETKYAATRVAFATGQIDVEQMRVIVNAAERMPARASAEDREAAEADLVEKAVGGMNPDRLRHAARRMLEKVSKELADEQEADMLDDENAKARNETWLTLHDNGDGTFAGKFVIPELQGNLLRTVLEKLGSPRRWSRNRAGESVTDDTMPGSAGLNRSESLGAAFAELCEHLPTDGWGRSNIGVVVHIDLEHLRDGLGGATLDTGTRISAGETRRLACQAGLIPAVLGGESQVLDLGRTRRLHTEAQRLALSTRHDTCAAEGCERPFAWSEIHHKVPWSEGGPTDLDNGIPLCGWHHGKAHDPAYRMQHLDTGEVRFRRRPRTPRISDRAAA